MGTNDVEQVLTTPIWKTSGGTTAWLESICASSGRLSAGQFLVLVRAGELVHSATPSDLPDVVPGPLTPGATNSSTGDRPELTLGQNLQLSA